MSAGGQSSLADYCTYYVAYSDGSCTDVNSARAPDRMLGEMRGSNSRWRHLQRFGYTHNYIHCCVVIIVNLLMSRCMASTLVRTGFVRGSMTQGNGCYQHRCTNNSLEVNTVHSISWHLNLLCIPIVLGVSFLLNSIFVFGWNVFISCVVHCDYHKYSCMSSVGFLKIFNSS